MNYANTLKPLLVWPFLNQFCCNSVTIHCFWYSMSEVPCIKLREDNLHSKIQPYPTNWATSNLPKSSASYITRNSSFYTTQKLFWKKGLKWTNAPIGDSTDHYKDNWMKKNKRIKKGMQKPTNGKVPLKCRHHRQESRVLICKCLVKYHLSRDGQTQKHQCRLAQLKRCQKDHHKNTQQWQKPQNLRHPISPLLKWW